MAVSSSSSSGAPTDPVWLYQLIAGHKIQRVALVEAPRPLPPLISYLGINYIWSDIHLCFLNTSPTVVQASGRTQIISPTANPQF